MTQSSTPWDGISVGDASASPYSANEWAHYWNLLNGIGSIFPNYGVLPGTGDGTYDPLQVIAVGAAVVEVKIGAALVNGKIYETDAAVQLTVGANASGNPRIDTVILRVDYTAQTIRTVIKQGTPAGSPARPSLQQDTSIWEIPLADIAVANGFSSIAQSDITDRRRAGQSSAAGWLPYAYSMCHIPNGDYSSNLQSIQFLAVPFQIAGNMLVQQVVIRSGQNASNRNVTWGIYKQNTNDAVASEKNLYRVGGRESGTLFSFTIANAVLAAIPAPVFLTPGTYWVAINFDGSLSVPSILMNNFDANTNKSYIATGGVGSIGQTLDLTTGWTKDFLSYAVRLEGRVFGEAAAF